MSSFWKKGITVILVIGVFLTPVSPVVTSTGKHELKLTENKAQAASITDIFGGNSYIDESSIQPHSNAVSFKVNIELGNDYKESGNTRIGSSGTWINNKGAKGTWIRTNGIGLGVTSGKWPQVSEGNNLTWWKADNENGTSGTWSYQWGQTGQASSGTWKTEEGIGGSGEASFTVSQFLTYYDYIEGTAGDPRTGIYFSIKKNGTEEVNKDKTYLTSFSDSSGKAVSFDTTKTKNTFSLTTGPILEPNTSYTIQLVINGNQKGYWFDHYDPFISKAISFTTKAAGEDNVDDEYGRGNNESSGEGIADIELDCMTFPGSINIEGCIANLFYVIWSGVAAPVARLAGHILDYFVYYSTNDDSYRSGFMEKGWAAIRDLANIFFLITLLYVAVKTVLGLNVSNNKKLISYIIIIALVINFSLFISKVVIDSSNILAKVFYNNITPKDANGQDITTAEDAYGIGQKSISIGIIDKYNPQGLFTQTTAEAHTGYFIFITLLLIVITLYTAFIFFSVSLLFVARTISLWIYSIFSPIAFISYAVPFKMPFGHQEWWKNILENAFLAPLFIFFLYIIIMFTGFLSSETIVADAIQTKGDIFAAAMKVAIPFLIIAMLLRQAKKLAVQYAGEMGTMINKAGSTVGGLALGAVTGGAGLALSGTLGKIGATMASKEKWKEKAKEKGMGGWAARMALKTGDYASKATFDARKSPLGSLAAKAGLNIKASEKLISGKATAGGYKGSVERKQQKIEKEFELYKTKMTTDEEVAKWSKENGYNYKTAFDLNEARMHAYRDNIGKSDLLYSLAYSTAKNASAQGTSEENLDKYAKRIKLGIGAAGILVGGLTGAGVLGTWGGGVGTAIGAGAAGGLKYVTDIGAQKAAGKKFDKDLAKEGVQLKELGKVKEDIKRLEELRSAVEGEGERGDKDYDEYVREKIAVKEQELEAAKAESAEYRRRRAELNMRLSSLPANSLERLNINTELANIGAFEKKSRDEAISAMKDKERYVMARDAQEKIARLRNREGSLYGQLDHGGGEKKKDKDIPKASGGGGSHEGGHDSGGHAEEHGGGDHGGHH